MRRCPTVSGPIAFCFCRGIGFPERARLLIEQAEALGEPPEDPLLLFSVFYSFWVASLAAFDGSVVRTLRSSSVFTGGAS
jgi:hypothetical protein